MRRLLKKRMKKLNKELTEIMGVIRRAESVLEDYKEGEVKGWNYRDAVNVILNHKKREALLIAEKERYLIGG